MAKIAYLAHDLADASIRRRTVMLSRGGASVCLAGFRRRADQNGVAAWKPIELGQTRDSRLANRAVAVAASAARIGTLAPAVEGADVILARNLEMLSLASLARKRFAPKARMIYECLDIHRLLTSKGPAGIMLRALETRLWRQAEAILTSSPAFVREYFGLRGYRGDILLVENKVLDTIGVAREAATNRRPGPPWRIGYFGMLRCRRSFDILGKLAAAMEGRVQVAIRGVPSPAIFPEFQREIDAMPHVTFHGPYNGAEALRAAYRDVHFAWAIDYYEAGQNSTWLLPNRLYESIYFGAVPLALETVETGRWLQKRGAGLRFNDGIEQQLRAFLSSLTPERYAALCSEIDATNPRDIAFGLADCEDLVEALAGARASSLQAGSTILAQFCQP